jgi:hypothetical protein
MNVVNIFDGQSHNKNVLSRQREGASLKKNAIYFKSNIGRRR